MNMIKVILDYTNDHLARRYYTVALMKQKQATKLNTKTKRVSQALAKEDADDADQIEIAINVKI